jgi:hypothetical protein
MKTARLPYTKRNVWFASVLTVALLGHVAYIMNLMAEIHAHDRQGYEGEAAGFGVLIVVLLAAYLAAFTIPVLLAALERGSKPVSVWRLLLGLLPTIGLALLLLSILLIFAFQK